VAQAALERAGGLLGGEVEEHLRGGDEQHRVPREDGRVGDVLRDHGLPEPTLGDEHDVPLRVDEVSEHGRLDERAIDLGGPAPVEVDHGLELLELAALHPAVEAAARAVLLLEVDDVGERVDEAPALLGRGGDEVVEQRGRSVEAEGEHARAELVRHGASSSSARAASES